MKYIIDLPFADDELKKKGWSLDFDYLQKIQRIAQKDSGEQISLESVESVILATRKPSEILRCPTCKTTIHD